MERDPEVGLADLDEVILQLRELLHQAVEHLGGGRQQPRRELLVQPRILQQRGKMKKKFIKRETA